MATDENPLWTPDSRLRDQREINMFRGAFAALLGRPLHVYKEFHAASVAHRDVFWSLIWDRYHIIGDKGGRILGQDTMPGAEFFLDARLNFAENLLIGDDDRLAILFQAEDRVSRRMTLGELRDLVSRAQQWLIASGVGPGDRVAAMLDRHIQL